MTDPSVFEVPPDRLVEARQLAHHACQWLARAARANLPPREDDAQTSLVRDPQFGALVTHELCPDRSRRVGFGFGRGALLWIEDGNLAATHEPVDAAAAEAWLEARLRASGLRGLEGVRLPYDPEGPFDCAAFPLRHAALRTLGAWFGVGQGALEAVARALSGRRPGPSPVRCWPHAFDVATRVVLAEGDPATAPSVGVGFSPGDATLAQPYFYCRPCPAPDVDALPRAPAPFRWHTEGSTALRAPAAAVPEKVPPHEPLLEAYRVAEAALPSRRG